MIPDLRIIDKYQGPIIIEQTTAYTHYLFLQLNRDVRENAFENMGFNVIFY